MEVPGLGVQIGAASLSLSPWQYQILNPLREARDQTCILMDTSRVPVNQNRNLQFVPLKKMCAFYLSNDIY